MTGGTGYDVGSGLLEPPEDRMPVDRYAMFDSRPEAFSGSFDLSA